MWTMSKINLVTDSLITQLIEAIDTSSSIYILTSFVMKSGVELLEDSLKRALERGAEVKVCTGDYLFVTQPDALRKLIKINPEIEVRLWKSNGRAFHPKAYLFQYKENEGTLIIGSSNMSRSAFTHGVEWNVSMDATVSKETFQKALDEFMKLFLNEQTVTVNNETVDEYEKLYEDYHREHPEFSSYLD